MDSDSSNDQHAHKTQARATTDADSLSKEKVMHSQRDFRTELIRSDVGGVVISLTLLLVWLYLGIKMSLPWTLYLIVMFPIWEVAFTQMYRMCHKMKLSDPDDPLIYIARNSLTHVEDQIWLQRNVLWWKYLPYFVAVVAVIVQFVWLSVPEGWTIGQESVETVVGTISVVAFTFLFVYFVIRYSLSMYRNVALSNLETRRQELLTLLAGLSD